MQRQSLGWLAGLGLLMMMPAVSGAPRLSSDGPVSTAGYYQLTWHEEAPADDDGWQFELEESAGAGFGDSRTLYRGRDTARVISGKSNGTRFYRIRVIDEQGGGPWSDTVKVEVAHHPLARAFTVFAIGLVVFLATVILIVSGTRQSAQPG